VVRTKKKRYSERLLVGKPKGMKPLGAPKRRYERNGKLDCQEGRWKGMDWNH
jgi:hypothetical protein